MRRSEYPIISSRYVPTLSGVYRSISSVSLRAPVMLQAYWASRSPFTSTCGLTFWAISDHSSGSSSPPLNRRMGGICSPSWNISRTPKGIDPGANPPTSTWCAWLAVMAIISPP